MATELCDRCVICDLCDVKDIVAPPPKCQNFVQRPMTNYDKLHAMNVEGMAELFTSLHFNDKQYFFYCPAVEDVGEGACAASDRDCRKCFLDWLNEVCTAEKEGEQQNNAD